MTKFKNLLRVACCVLGIHLVTSVATMAMAQSSVALPAVMLTTGQLINTNSSPMPVVNTNTLAGIPESTSFTNAKVELFVGAVMQGDSSFNNSIEIRYDFTPTWFASAQIQNSQAASVINAASVYIGYRMAWDTTEIWLKAGGGRDWNLATYKGEVWFGIAYAPFQDSSSQFLNKVSTFVEQGAILSKGNKAASTETIGGVTYHF